MKRTSNKYNLGAMPRISEHEEQANFVQEVKMRYGNRDDFVDTLFFANPNGLIVGGDNKFAIMAKFKKEGFKNGVADIIYLQPRGEYNCLAIEMKARRDMNPAPLSDEQAEFLAAVNENGGTGEVCYGCEEAVAVFDWYMNL